MRRSRTTKKRALAFIVIFASMSIWAGIAGVLAAENKVAVVVTAPDEVGAGTTTDFTVSLANQAGTQQLGSANLTVPSGFQLVSAALEPPHAAGATIAVVGSTVQLRSLAIQPGAQQLVRVTAIAPCLAGTPVTRTWAAIVKQSNNFSGPPGNNFTIGAASDLTTNVVGSCHLAFTSRPASARVDETITTAELDPSGPPVQVELRDADGGTITVPSLQTAVTVAIGANPAGGTLAGDATDTTSSGVATFGGLSIDSVGTGYTLSAAASEASIESGTSGTFDIVGAEDSCEAGGCTDSTSLGSTQATLTSNSSESGYTQFIALDDSELDCPGYTEVTATATFEVMAETGTAQVTLTILRSVLPPDRQHLDSFKVCYEAPKPFTPLRGTSLIEGDGVFIGLLPKCINVNGVAPCIVSRTSKPTSFSITFSTPLGDPRGKG